MSCEEGGGGAIEENASVWLWRGSMHRYGGAKMIRAIEEKPKKVKKENGRENMVRIQIEVRRIVLYRVRIGSVRKKIKGDCHGRLQIQLSIKNIRPKN